MIDEGYCTHPDHIGTRCQPVSAFRRRLDRPMGVYSWCRQCEARERKRKRLLAAQADAQTKRRTKNAMS